MTEFLQVQPTVQNRWRALILLGRNTAAYKFALADALLQGDVGDSDLLRIDELALPFAQSLSNHVAAAPKQGSTGLNRAMQSACEDFNAGSISDEQLRTIACHHGFGDVIDAFHVLGGRAIEEPFFIDERKESKGIRLTDHFYALVNAVEREDLGREVDARWRTVETGWALGVNAGLVEFERETGTLSLRSGDRRLALRSCCATLNGYQKGKCFYCFAPISVEAGPNCADVDHFFPWALRSRFANADGIWNLVLACQACNRGRGGKFDAIPSIDLLERLNRRNEFYVDSKHKLGTTIMAQTGRTSAARRSHLQQAFADLTYVRIHHWMPDPRAEPAL